MKSNIILVIGICLLLVSMIFISAAETTGKFTVTGEAVEDAECLDEEKEVDNNCAEEEGFLEKIKGFFKGIFDWFK